MTVKSLCIMYITNCFLWTMSDNKAYLISYLIDAGMIITELLTKKRTIQV